MKLNMIVVVAIMISIIATDTTVFTLGVVVLLMFIDQIYRIIFLKYVKKII